MSHMININNGRASMMYFGEAPWHGLGTKLSNPATAAEAIAAAGLGFKVGKLPNIHRFPDGTEEISNSSFFTYREDTGDILGTRLGPGYTVLQNVDAFTPFDAIVGEGEAIYHTAGVIGRGERVWILAKMPDYVRVRVNGHDDPVEKYLLLAQAHDGSLAVKVKLTPVRVVCNNTLSNALNIYGGRAHDDDETISIKHGRDVKRNVKGAAKRLGLYNQMYEQLEQIYNQMALRKVSGQDIVNYVKTLLPPPEDSELSTRTRNQQDAVLELVEVGKGANVARGTLWGAYNAITEYTDHVATVAGSGSTLLKSVWFGGAREMLKDRAFKLALNMMN